jgi:hypothetical protein
MDNLLALHIDKQLPLHRLEDRPLFEEAVGRVPNLIQQLDQTLEELQRLFPRQFVPEGCLDQSVGEVRATLIYDLELVESRTKVSVAKMSDGRTAQLKVTRSRRGTVGLYDRPESLLVLQLSGKELVELYNGPTAIVWEKAGKTRKTGERRIPVSRLRSLGESIPGDCKIPSTAILSDLSV